MALPPEVGFPGGDGFDGVTIRGSWIRLRCGRDNCRRALLVGDAGWRGGTPCGDGVAPDLGLAGLIFELMQNFREALIVDVVFERFPVVHIGLDGLGALVVRIVDGLNDGFAGVQLIGIGDVVQEEQQVVGTGGSSDSQVGY